MAHSWLPYRQSCTNVDQFPTWAFAELQSLLAYKATLAGSLCIKGARNNTLRTRVIWQDWMATGQLSVAPDVMDGEAKAARLHRYAELRWSLVTSSPTSGREY